MWSCVGEGAFRCSLNLSPKVLADSPIYSSLLSTLLHLNLYMTPLLLRIGSLSLGVIRKLLMVGPPFRCAPILYFSEKPTHTNQYLHWDSHHAIPSKYSMIGTLINRAKTICSGPTQLQEEEEHLYNILMKCKYPTWALNRVKLRHPTSATRKKNNNRNSNPNNNRDQQSHITVPYHQGLSESFKRTCKKYGIEVHLKGGPTIKNLLMTPKDKDPILKRSGVIYRFKCNRVECDEEYIGESARNFGERFKDHLKAPSPTHDHINISGHTMSIEDFSILARGDQNLLRTIKEAIYIRANNPSLNRNVGKFHLPHIWDEVLLNISELNLK